MSFRYATLVLLFGLAGLGLHGVKTLAGLHVLEHCPKEMVRGTERQMQGGREAKKERKRVRKLPTHSAEASLTDCTVG